MKRSLETRVDSALSFVVPATVYFARIGIVKGEVAESASDIFLINLAKTLQGASAEGIL